MTKLQENLVFIIAEMLPAVIVTYKWKTLDLASKLFGILAWLSFLIECVALYYAVKTQDSRIAYNIGAIILTVLFCLYFNFAVAFFTKKSIGYILALLSIAVWLFCVWKDRSLRSFNTAFLYYQNILIAVMSIIAIQSFYQPGKRQLRKPVHHWIATILLMAMCSTFCEWGFYDQIVNTHPAFEDYINLYLTAVPIAVDIAICFLFLSYQKAFLKYE